MQAITCARSHHYRNCTSSTGRWSCIGSGWCSPLLLNLQIHQIMPWAVETVSSSFREFNLKSEHCFGSLGAHTWPWARERGGFLSPTLLCVFITLLGAQCLQDLHQIWQNWPRNWNITKREAGGSHRNTWVDVQQVMHWPGDREEQTEKRVGGTCRPGSQNHWTNIRPNYL